MANLVGTYKPVRGGRRLTNTPLTRLKWSGVAEIYLELNGGPQKERAKSPMGDELTAIIVKP